MQRSSVWVKLFTMPAGAISSAKAAMLASTARPSARPSARAVAGYADYQLAYGEVAAEKLVRVEQNADGSLSAHPAIKATTMDHSKFYIKCLESNHSNATQGVNNGNI